MPDACFKKDCNGTLQSMNSIEIPLPTPENEIVLGGRNPNYSTKVQLPFVFCDECRQVFYPKEEEESEE